MLGRRFASLFVAAASLLACTDTDEASKAKPKTDEPPTPVVEAPDAGHVDAAADAGEGTLSIQDVAVFQTVRASLMQPGRVRTPLIADKTAMLRAYLMPTGNLDGRAVRVEFRVADAGGAHTYAADAIARAADDLHPEGLASVILPAAVVTATSSLAVDVRDGSSGALLSSWPGGGKFHPLSATGAQGKLRLSLVPVQYDADSSHRLPDTSAATLALYKDTLLREYPVSEVDLTVHEPLVFAGAVTPRGGGWDELLGQITALRGNDRVDADVYYMGLVSPRDTQAQFCAGGCTLGLSGLSDDPTDPTQRASLALGYGGVEGTNTIVHELGHAHGRYHAPCGNAGGPDSAFPYADGGIGVWGYDNQLAILYPPQKGKDMMGYCDPAWISDYTYAGIHDRMVKSRATRTTMLSAGSVKVDVLAVAEDGSFVRSGSMSVARTLLEARAEGLGEDGRVALRPRVKSYALSHGTGKLVLVQPLPASIKRLHLE